MKKQFAVFGLGSFGESIALELQKLGCEVVAVDKDMERVNGIADSVSYAMQADIGDPEFIRSLGTRNLDAVVIAEAESLEASIMAALECKGKSCILIRQFRFIIELKSLDEKIKSYRRCIIC